MSDYIDSLFVVPDYVQELKDALEMHDFFKVLAFSSTLMESYGKQILIKYYRIRNKRTDQRIQDLNLNATLIMLYSNRIISKLLFEDMDYIRRERNNFVHALNPEIIAVLTRSKVKTAEDLAHKAIRSIFELIKIHSKYNDFARGKAGTRI